jgi:hypothetical protein
VVVQLWNLDNNRHQSRDGTGSRLSSTQQIMDVEWNEDDPFEKVTKFNGKSPATVAILRLAFTCWKMRRFVYDKCTFLWRRIQFAYGNEEGDIRPRFHGSFVKFMERFGEKVLDVKHGMRVSDSSLDITLPCCSSVVLLGAASEQLIPSCTHGPSPGLISVKLSRTRLPLCCHWTWWTVVATHQPRFSFTSSSS